MGADDGGGDGGAGLGGKEGRMGMATGRLLLLLKTGPPRAVGGRGCGRGCAVEGARPVVVEVVVVVVVAGRSMV